MRLPPQQSQTRLTKIVCTIGPSTSSWDALAGLAQAGMNLARLNMSHGDHASHLQVIRNLKSLSKKLSHPVSILMDLQGPEIRTGELSKSLDLKAGDVFYFTVLADDAEERSVHVNYRDLVNDLRAGERVTVDNGLINLEVLEVSEHRLKCKVLDGGTLGSRKHVNLPGVRVNLPSVTKKDREDIALAIEQDLDFIALSFVRGAEDLLQARELINEAGGHQRLIAKIENQEGIDNFDAILEAADGIMVARGDLGVEVAFEELPVLQRDMIRRCAIAGKPIIVATHLLESMIDNPLPTRAEVTDVANAVYEQADAIMLSGETAAGKYPVRCVEVLDTIARRTEMVPGLDFYKERPAANHAACTRSAERVPSCGLTGRACDRRDDAPRLLRSARCELPTSARDHLRVHEHEHDPAQALAEPRGDSVSHESVPRPREDDRQRARQAARARRDRSGRARGGRFGCGHGDGGFGDQHTSAGLRVAIEAVWP